MLPNPVRALLRTEPFDEGEDPDAAPLAYCGSEPARPWTARRWAQNFGFIFVTGLLFMGFAIAPLYEGDPSLLEMIVRASLVIFVSLAYLATPLVADTPAVVRWCYVGFFLALTASTASYQGWEFVYLGVYVSVVIAALLPWRYSRLAVLIWSLVVLAAAIPIGGFVPAMIAALGLLAGWGLGISFESIRVRHRLSAARQRVSVLSVEAERERIARDLHDILGHSLTAISIKSGLAVRLAEQDPAAARAQMTDVEQIARLALNDVRATATGLREVRLAAEIAGARSVLMAAGVEAVTPSAVPPMPESASELLGYVVREAVTNVVRHAEATRCMIAIEDRAVTVADDGIGIQRSGPRGSGLSGLEQRLSAGGGSLIINAGESGGTVLRAELPAAPELKPTTSRTSEEVITTS